MATLFAITAWGPGGAAPAAPAGWTNHGATEDDAVACTGDGHVDAVARGGKHRSYMRRNQSRFSIGLIR